MEATINLARWAQEAHNELKQNTAWQKSLCDKLDKLNHLLEKRGEQHEELKQIVMRQAQQQEMTDLRVKELATWKEAMEKAERADHKRFEDRVWGIAKPLLMLALMAGLLLGGVQFFKMQSAVMERLITNDQNRGPMPKEK